MKYFLIGLGAIIGINLLVIGGQQLLTAVGVSPDNAGYILVAVLLLLIAKQFGELTVSVFRKSKFNA